MKYYFDKKLLDYLNLDYILYKKIEILEVIINNKNNWNNLNEKIIINKKLLDIIKYKYPKDSEVNYNMLFNNTQYWKNQLEKGFKISALRIIIDSCIVNNCNNYDNESLLDKGNNIVNLVI